MRPVFGWRARFGETKMKKPLVSVVVPTKNSESTVEDCLRSIKRQTYSNIETIVVDNYSTDKTREIAEKNGARVYLIGPERTSQMNFGTRKAQGKYVYFVGSDFVLEPLIVEEAVVKCEGEGYDAVAVHNTSDPSISFWSKVRKLERDCYKDDDLNVGARFFKTEVFDTVGGFDETLVAAEDYDLQNRVVEKGFRVGRIRSQEIHIGEPRTLSEIVRKHFYYGKSIQNYVNKNPRMYKRQLSPVRLSYFRHVSRFAKNPELAAGFVVYQFVRYFSTAIGLLVTELERAA